MGLSFQPLIQSHVYNLSHVKLYHLLLEYASIWYNDNWDAVEKMKLESRRDFVFLVSWLALEWLNL